MTPACVTECPDYSGERAESRHPAVLPSHSWHTYASKRETGVPIIWSWFSGFEKGLIQRCSDSLGRLHYPVVLVILPHGTSCVRALLLTEHTSLLQPRSAMQKQISCVYDFWQTKGHLPLFQVAQKRQTLLCLLNAAQPFNNLRSRKLFPD